MIRHTATALLLAVVLAGCSDPTEFGRPGEVTVRADRGGIEIHNGRAAPIYYMAVERGTAALILWAPCDRPDQCSTVEARGRRRLAAAEIYGWERSPEVVLYWWHLVPDRGGFRVDSIRAVVGGR